MEQAQPLVHVMAKNATDIKAPVAVDNPKVAVSVVKDSGDGRTFVVRLRSLSDGEESVYVSYPRCAPATAHICGVDETPAASFDGSLTMRPYGMTTLLLKF